MADWIQNTQMNAPFTIDDDDEEDNEVSFGSFRADVVGIRYYNGKVNNHEMVSLRREPNNKYDKNAIRVDNVFGQQVGHMKREQAAALAPLVDKKYARIEGVVPYGTKNKFSMPCDVTLSGLPEHMERSQEMMRRRGYQMTTVISEGLEPQQASNSRTPSRAPQYAAKNTVNKELVNMTTQQKEHEMENLFGNTFDKNKYTLQEPCEAVKMDLYPHQKQALAWMIARENNEGLPPFWERRGNNYTNTMVNFTSQRKPQVVKGGLLADDMGLGKTLSIISLVVTNYRNKQPLITVDKTSSVQRDLVKKKTVQRRRSSVNKTKEKIVVSDEEEIEEPALPSFDSNVDVDYKPLEVPESEANKGTIASHRSRRTASKKPKYNFDNDNDWLCENEMDNAISPAKKRKATETKRETKKKKADTDDTHTSSQQTTNIPSSSCHPVLTENVKSAPEEVSTVSENTSVETVGNSAETTTVTSFKVSRVTLPGPRATLIVCPLSVMQNWLDQIENHLEYKALDVYTYYGSDRCQKPDELATKDIVLTTYQTLSSDYSKMKKSDMKKKSTLHQVEWLRIVLDEGHCIRNMTSNQSKACVALEAERRWLVTGTPVQNSIKDLWSIMCFLRIEPLNKKEWWSRTIEKPLSCRNDYAALNAKKCLQSILLRISIRRTKQHKVNGKHVVELPSKTVFIQYVEFAEEEKKLYDTFKNEGQAIMARYISAKTLSSNYAHMLVILMRLRQLCCHPKLCAQIVDFFKDISNPNSSATPDELRKKLQQILSVLLSSGNEECPICLDDLNNPVITHCAHMYCRQCIENVIKEDKPQCPLCRGDIARNKLVEPVVEPALEESTTDGGNDVTDAPATWSSSSKVDGLITLLNKEKEENSRRKHLVVSQFTQFLNLLEKPLQESGFKFVRLDGSMAVKKRNDAISMFSDSADDSPTVMLLSLKAGGVGLNLTAASRVFLMDPAWNPATEEQCFDRCHRLGQTEDVKVFKFIVKDTVEERMLELQDKKKDLMNRTFGQKESAKDRQEQRLRDVQKLLS